MISSAPMLTVLGNGLILDEMVRAFIRATRTVTIKINFTAQYHYPVKIN